MPDMSGRLLLMSGRELRPCRTFSPAGFNTHKMSDKDNKNYHWYLPVIGWGKCLTGFQNVRQNVEDLPDILSGMLEIIFAITDTLVEILKVPWSQGIHANSKVHFAGCPPICVYSRCGNLPPPPNRKWINTSWSVGDYLSHLITDTDKRPRLVIVMFCPKLESKTLVANCPLLHLASRAPNINRYAPNMWSDTSCLTLTDLKGFDLYFWPWPSPQIKEVQRQRTRLLAIDLEI